MDAIKLSIAEIITIILAIIAIATYVLAIARDRKSEQQSQSQASAAAARSDAKLDSVASDVRSTKESIDKLYGKFDGMKDDLRGMDSRIVKVETTCEGHEQRIRNLEENNN